MEGAKSAQYAIPPRPRGGSGRTGFSSVCRIRLRSRNERTPSPGPHLRHQPQLPLRRYRDHAARSRPPRRGRGLLPDSPFGMPIPPHSLSSAPRRTRSQFMVYQPFFPPRASIPSQTSAGVARTEDAGYPGRTFHPPTRSPGYGTSPGDPPRGLVRFGTGSSSAQRARGSLPGTSESSTDEVPDPFVLADHPVREPSPAPATSACTGGDEVESSTSSGAALGPGRGSRAGAERPLAGVRCASDRGR